MPDLPTPQSPPGGRPPAHPLRLPSRRSTAILAASMLALGVGIGAAIGPTPGASQASAGAIVGSVVVPYLNEVEAARLASAAQTQTTSTPAPTSRRKRKRHRRRGSAAVSTATTTTSSTTTSTSTSTSGAAPAATLPPVTSVWLIELSGSTFAEALAQPAAAPNIDSKIIPSGSLLSDWTAIDAGAFAGEAALLGAQEAAAEGKPQTLQTITEPLCPEGAPGASCAPGTTGALAAADSFLQSTLPVITASPAYGAHGLIVVTFGSLGAGSAEGLPTGSQTATLISKPPAGVLLISPFAHAGTRPTTTFNPTSPRQSLEQLLQR